MKISTECLAIISLSKRKRDKVLSIIEKQEQNASYAKQKNIEDLKWVKQKQRENGLLRYSAT